MNRAVPARPLFVITLLAAVVAAAPARAQFLSAELDRTGIDQRLRQPALRLTTLGRLSLAFDDENNEINQWDFGGSAVGLLDDREGNAADLFVDSGNRSSQATIDGLTREVDRAGSHVLGFSGSARTPGKFAFGLDAGYQGFGAGIPGQLGLYRDESIGFTQAVATFSGRGMGKRLGWGARLGFGRENLDNLLRTRGQKDGELLLSGGDVLEDSDIFLPNEGRAELAKYGLGLGWMAASWGDVTVNWDHAKTTVKQSNNTRRRVYETEEPRSDDSFSLVTTLRPAPWITLGGTVGTGGYDATESYRFSFSLGQGAPPIQARGERLARTVDHEFLRARVALAPPSVPALLVGADLNVNYRKEAIDPATGPADFNPLLDAARLFGFQGGGPSLVVETQEVRHWDAGLGLGYRVGPKLALGVEGHRGNDARDGTLVHARRRATDLRAGLEYAVSPSWQARVGGWRRGLDEDVFTANNEGVATAFTLGAGFRPPRSHMALDAGVEILDRSTDYPDPNDGTGSGFRFVLYNRWSFN